MIIFNLFLLVSLGKCPDTIHYNGYLTIYRHSLGV